MKLSSKTTVHWTPALDAIRAFALDQPGADLGILEAVTKLVVGGFAVDPTLQKIANAIMAKAVLDGALPTKKRGRGPADPFVRHCVAYRFLELTDGGMSQKEALALVEEEWIVVERNIRSFVSDFKPMIGLFPEDRERFRTWRAACEAMGQDYEEIVRGDIALRAGEPAGRYEPSHEDADLLVKQLRAQASTAGNSV